MSFEFNAPQRSLEARRRLQTVADLRRLAIWQRIDTALLTIALFAVVVIGGGWLALAEVSRRADIRNAQPLAPVADHRILNNIRDQLPQEAYRSITIHADELVMAQSGGTFHFYNPGPQLWRSERPFLSDAPFPRDGFQLGSSGARLWSRGTDDSLAMRDPNGLWHIASGNTAFVRADGTPITQADLTSAALLAGTNQLYVGTSDAGIGRYDLTRRAWVPAVENAPVAVRDLVAWNGGLLIAPIGAGLFTLNPDNQAQAVAAITGTVLDLDFDPSSGTLIALERGPCTGVGQGCSRVWQFRPGSEPITVLDERNNYPELNLQVLHFAQMWGDRLVLAGQNGIFTYDTASRSWDRLLEGRVGRTATLATDDGFYFETPQVLGLARPAVAGTPAEPSPLQTWELPLNDPVRSLTVREDDTPLALLQSGALVTLDDEAQLATLREGGGTDVDPAAFSSVLAAQDLFIFRHADGAVLHDTARRTYDDLAVSNLPAWFELADRIITVADAVYFLTPTDGPSVYPVALANLADVGYLRGGGLFGVQASDVPGPVQHPFAWGGNTLGVVSSEGDLYRVLGSSGTVRLSAATEPGLTQAAFVDAVATDSATFFAQADRILRYDLADRSWQTVIRLQNTSETIREVLTFDNQPYAVTSANRLLDARANPVIGAVSNGRTYDLNTLTDAQAISDALYTAGNGTVERYRWSQRRIDADWVLDPEGGDVRLRAILDDQPLAQIGERAFFGETSVAPAAAPVTTLSHDDLWIWTTRELPTHRYLMGHRTNNVSETRCYFRQPDPDATLQEAVRLPDGLIAVATSTGLQFYRPDARTWVSAPATLLNPTRVHLLGDHLLLSTSTDFALVPLNDLRMPPTCSDAAAVAVPTLTGTAPMLTVHPSQSRFAWIAPDGSVREWQNGIETEWLPPPGSTPDPATLRRAFDGTAFGYAAFSSLDAVWLYDIARGAWRRIDVRLPSGVVLSDLRVTGDAERLTISATATDGTPYQSQVAVLTGNFEAIAAALSAVPTSAPAGTPSPTQPPPTSFTLGPATVTHDGTSVSVTLDGLSALDARGFTWDVERRGLAYEGNKLLVQTAAGIRPVQSLDLLDRSLLQTNVVLAGSTVDGPVARDPVSGQWQVRRDGVWQGTDDPLASRPLFSDAIWRWELVNGGVTVTLAGNPFAFALTDGGFSSDRLREAVAHDGQLIVTTDAFTEIAAADLFGTYAASRQAPIAGRDYEIVHVADDTTQLLARDNNGNTLQWDAASATFATVPTGADDPRTDRPLVRTNHLRISLVNGAPIMQLRVVDPAGNEAFVPFSFNDGRWPFDVVTSAASHDGTLYVGTLAGLQVYTSLAFGTDAPAVLDYRGTSGGGLAAVQSVGVPTANPDVFMARGNLACYQRTSGSASLVACPDATLLDERLRVDQPLWRWVRAANLAGQYRDSAGRLNPRSIAPIAGRLPHDRFTDATFCQGQTRLLWDGRAVSHYNGSTIALLGQTRLEFLDGPRQFYCFENPVITAAGVTIPAGTYLLGAQSYVDRGASWQPLTDQALIDAIETYRAPLYERADLRYSEGRFQQRAAATWIDLPWRQSALDEQWRVSLDIWQHVLPVGDALWAATDDGWVSFALDSEDQVFVDPDNLTVIRDPVFTDGDCVVTDARAAEDDVLMRCNGRSEQVFQVSLASASATNALTLLADDPFVTQARIDTPLWSWQTVGRVGNARGTLEATWQGQPLVLANGHLAWDRLTALAFFSAGLQETTSEGAGWLVADRGDWSLASLHPPQVTTAVDATALSRVQIALNDGLCLQIAEGDYLRFNAERQFQDQTADCPVLLAQDDFWQYLRSADGLRIPARTDAAITRALQDGRFTDDRVIGLPAYDAAEDRFRVPSAAGVLTWNPAADLLAITSGDFAGLPPDAAPAVLWTTPQGAIVYPAQDGWYDLDAQTMALPLDRAGLSDATFTGATTFGDDLLVSWRQDDTAGFSRYDLSAQTREDNRLTLDIRALTAYLTNQQALDNPDPVMTLAFTETGIVARFAEGETFLTWPDGFAPTAIEPRTDTVYVVGERDLLAVDLNALIARMARKTDAGD